MFYVDGKASARRADDDASWRVAGLRRVPIGPDLGLCAQVAVQGVVRLAARGCFAIG